MRTRMRFLAAEATCGLAVVLLTGGIAARQPREDAVAALLDDYTAHRYQAVEAALSQVTPDRDFLSHLTKEAPRWVGDGAAAVTSPRAFAAATLLLQVVHLSIGQVDATGGSADWSGQRQRSRLQAILAAVRLVKSHEAGPAPEIERRWVLLGLATLLDWDHRLHDSMGLRNPGWAVALGAPPLLVLADVQSGFGRGGYLGWALGRFPGEPRLRLALAEAHEAIDTRCDLRWCFDESTPDVQEDLRRRAALPPASTPPGGASETWGPRDTAIVNLEDFKRLPTVAAGFAALADDPVVGAEADVHIGYLAIRAGRDDAAVAPLTAASHRARDPSVQYLAAYLSGRALEATGQRDDAAAAYRRALAIVPDAYAATTRLAALLLQSDRAADRAEVDPMLERAYRVSPSPTDPWDWYWQGDARLWAQDLASVQEVLP